jgi:hypothetical protein
MLTVFISMAMSRQEFDWAQLQSSEEGGSA